MTLTPNTELNRRNSLRYLLVLCCALFTVVGASIKSQPVLAATQQANTLRRTQTINLHWKFNYLPKSTLDESVAKVDYDDSQWRSVAVPHTWSTYETTDEVHPFIRSASETDDPYWWEGWGCYRKRFVPGEEVAGRKAFVEFDAVMKYCRVYLNGRFVGEHKGGYSSFFFDITNLLRIGKENVLVVCANNNRRDPYCIPPMYAGNMDVFGGIYRDVRLVVKDRLHIPFQGSDLHEGGAFITTPQVSEKAAIVKILTWVKNDYDKTQTCKLITTLRDRDGKTLETLVKTAEIKPGEIRRFEQMSGTMPNPRLWSPESPYVYTAHSEIALNDNIVDECDGPFGIRWFAWNYEENRLYLNGKKVHIHGTNRVQDYPWVGDAVPKWLLEKDMRDIRFNLNHNFIRSNIHAQDPLFYDLCDRYGIIVVEAVPNIKRIDFDEDVQKSQVREMIRRDRNHPSIMFWSMGNETSDAADSAWAMEEDSTRIINARHVYNDSAGACAPHTHDNLDFEDLLRCTVRGWTHDDIKDFKPTSAQIASNEEWQHQLARIQDASQRGRIDMPNGVMWMYADSGADREYKNCPLKHINPKGWVDLYRVPKYMYYLWQANYIERPMAFIHPHFWQRKYLGQKKDIVVDSNCESVELFVNGKNHGVLNPSADNFFTVTFKDVEVEPGTILVKGQKNGKNASNKVVMAGEPAKIILTASHKNIDAAQHSIVQVMADAVDAQGVHVQGFTQTLRWYVDGPATLVGPPVYASDFDRKEEMEGPMYITTPIPNLIRSTGKPGAITVRVESDGLICGQVVIEAAAIVDDPSKPFAEPAVSLSASRKPMRRQMSIINTGSAGDEANLSVSHEDIQLTPGLGIKSYAEIMRNTLRRRHPGIERNAVEFNLLVNRFASHLKKNTALLVDDDYNFAVGQYNDCLEVTRAIDKTKLPSEFKKSQIKYYAHTFLDKGAPVDKKRVLDTFSRIPADSIAVVADGNNLQRLVSKVHPAFSQFDATAQKRVCEYLCEINTYIDPKTYQVAQGRVIIIPTLENLKKQAEQ